MHLFVDISSHGFGHLAITAPVLNALAASTPDLRLTLRTTLPIAKLRERIHAPFELIEARTDFGYVMIDATHIDLPASAHAYRAAHAHWPARVAEETRLLTRLAPDLVFSNVSYLPLAGAAQRRIPAIALCSLNWADLFQHYFGRESWAAPIHQQMLNAYRSARHFLRVTPGMPMATLANLHPVAPIATLGQRHSLGLEGVRTVLIAMGGIAHHLPVDFWPRTPGIRWIVPGDWQCRHPDAIARERFDLSFTDLLCSVDAVLTKPGYGTFTEAACNGTPVLFQRRDDWPEQDCLIDWLTRHGRALDVDNTALQSGEFAPRLDELWQLPAPPLPRPDGAQEAARLIKAAGNRVS